MNERIERILKQATVVTEGWSDENGTTRYYSVDQKKFAELIVRECIEQASISNGHGNNQWDKALTFAAKNIKEHFGVEE